MNQVPYGEDRRGGSSLQEATFATTTDSGSLEKQSVLLCESLRRYYPDSRIVNFVPDSAIQDISEEARQFFETNTTVVTGEMPIPSYEPSAKLAAFSHAASVADDGYLVLLDSDVVLLSTITLPDDDAALYVKPVDKGVQYWGSSESLSDWRKLYDYFGVPFPTRRVRSTIDRRVILPYWNAGVVITDDRSIPDRLLEMTERIVTEDITDWTETIFSDQLALAVLSETTTVSRMWELQNYPMNDRLTCPRDVQVLHYREFQHLRRVLQPGIRRELRSLGFAPDRNDRINVGELLLGYLFAHSGKYLSYSQKRTMGEWIAPLLSDSGY